MFKTNNHIREMHMIGPDCRERFLPLLQNGPLRKLGVGQGGISQLKNEYYISRKNASITLILGTLGGKAKLTTADGKQILTKNDLLIAPQSTSYRYELIAKRPWNIVWFHLRDITLDRDRKIEITKTNLLPKLSTEIDDIIAEASVESLLAAEARAAKESYLAVLLQRLLKLNENPARNQHEAELTALWKTVMANPAKNWSLEQLAQIAGYSAGHLNRICRRYYGQAAMKQLTKLRMEHAAHLLTQSQIKIRSVAQIVGYDNQFAFSVAFKKHFHRPPSTLRS